MKNLTKLFMAVVAGMLAFSCVTDTTDDLGVNLGEGQTTTIFIALDDEARTYIDEADGEGYPMYWSEGDQISVNGKTSEPLTAADINGSNATFTVNGILINGNCSVAYPAAPKGHVKFAAVQTHKNDKTFGDGVTTMYGYGPKEGLILQPLTGILKVGVALPIDSEATTLTKAQISTVDRNHIAGDFAINFESGELTATATSTDVIEYSFGEGVALSNESAVYMHIAVPAGIYDELYVTLYTNKGVMKATIRATVDNPETEKEEKPLHAGMIRTFSVIPFEPNTDVYIIDSEDKLFEFAAAVKDGVAEGGTLFTKDVLLVEDITLTKSWETLDWDTTVTTVTGEGESAVTTSTITPVLFNGNGYAIKGLTAPLFGTTTASIKGLHLRDVNIEMSDLTYAGALACHIPNTEAVVEYCSATGTLAVNNVQTGYVGGIIGHSTTTKTFAHLHNKVNISVGGTSNGYFGGCMGYIGNGIISNSSNLGTITTNTAEDAKGMYVGGIASHAKGVFNSTNGAKDTTLGAITLDGTRTNSYACGIVAKLYASGVKNCHNYAPITQKGESTWSFLNGIVGENDSENDITIIDCTNSGVLTALNTKASSMNVAGIFAHTNNGNVTMENCHNYGSLTSSVESITTQNIGGLVAIVSDGKTLTMGGSEAKKCTNSGTITVDGGQKNIHAGGVLGQLAAASSTANISYVENSGTINMATTAATTLNVGGILGDQNTEGTVSSISKAINSGDITVGKTAATLHIGGIFGFADTNITSTISEISNSGGISIATESASVLHIGGILGSQANYAVSSISEADNSGAITVDSSKYGASYLGGIVAYSAVSKKAEGSLSIANVKNTATIEFKGASSADLCIGGFAGYYVNKTPTLSGTIVNEGELKYTGTGLGARLCAGGLIGLTDRGVGGANATLINTGDITCTGTCNPAKVNTVAGIVANKATSEGAVLNGRSFCDIVANLPAPTGDGAAYVGLACGSTAVVLTNMHCGGTISKDGGKNVITITKDNYYEYIHGKLAQDAEHAVFTYKSGCLSSIDAEPAYPAVTPTTDANIFVVSDIDTFKTFGAGITQKTVYFTNDIVWPAGETWIPSTYAGEVYGQGHKITGLNAPFFGITAATVIDGLHLENVNIESNTNILGALACKLTAKPVRVSNCSASGTIKPTNPSYIGGLIGQAPATENTPSTYGTFTNLECSVHITSGVKSTTSAGYYAGIISLQRGYMKNCKFTGSITLDADAELANVSVAGIVNYMQGTIENCTNGEEGDTDKGKISVQSTISNLFLVGGIYSGTSANGGARPDSMTGCKNYAEINIGATQTGSYFFIGGIGGLTHRVIKSITDCDNYGPINVSMKSTSAATNNNHIAGIGGVEGKAPAVLEDCHNYGAITITEEASFEDINLLIGGVSTNMQEGAGCKTDNLSNSGDIFVDGKANVNNTYIGGVLAKVNIELTNSKSACNIVAVDYTNVGMITGSARDAAAPKVKNCAVAGNIALSENSDNPIETFIVWQTIKAGDYFNYIYSSADWTGVEGYDGCTFDNTVVAKPE